MKRIVVWATASWLLAFLAPVCHSADPVKIGLVWDSSVWGSEPERAAALSREWFAKGMRLEIVTCLAGKPDVATQCAYRLADEKVAVVIGTGGKAIELASQAALKSRGLAYLSLSGVPLSKEERAPNFFRIRTTLGNVLTVAGQFARDSRPRKIAVVGDISRISNPDDTWKTLFGTDVRVLKRTEATVDEIRSLAPDAPDVILLLGPRPESVQQMLGATNSRFIVVTLRPVEAFPGLRSERAFVSTPHMFPTEKAGELWKAYRSLKEPATGGFLLPMAAAIQVLVKAIQPDGKVSLEAIQNGSFDTVLGPLRFSRDNGDALAPGLGAEIWQTTRDYGPVTAGTGSTQCTCSDTDCCATQCCIDNGCTTGNCKSVTCTNK